MIAMGFFEIVLLFVLGGGAGGADLVALVEPRAYFEARDITVSLDGMVELAVRSPKDAKGSVQQLVALRYLAEEADKLKKDKRYDAYRKALEGIAAGKTAQDPQGFAKEYAAAVLARIDGKAPAAADHPSLREDGLAWFPADATFVAGADLRGTRVGAGKTPQVAEFLKMMPPQERKKMYEIVEKLGNVRLDRVTFAYVDGAKGAGGGKIFVRFTGKANAKWFNNTLADLSPDLRVTEKKGPDGKAVTLFQAEGRPPVFAVLGDSELLMVGFERDRGSKHEDLIDEVFTVRAAKKETAANGVLKGQLKKVPDKAVALAVGSVPQNAVMGLDREFGGTPKNVLAFVDRTPTGFDFNVAITTDGADAAQQMVKKVSELRKQGIDGLKQLKQQPDAPVKLPVDALVNLLESLQVQGDGADVKVRLLVPREVLETLPGTLFFGARGGFVQPPALKE